MFYGVNEVFRDPCHLIHSSSFLLRFVPPLRDFTILFFFLSALYEVTYKKTVSFKRCNFISRTSKMLTTIANKYYNASIKLGYFYVLYNV